MNITSRLTRLAVLTLLLGTVFISGCADKAEPEATDTPAAGSEYDGGAGGVETP